MLTPAAWLQLLEPKLDEQAGYAQGRRDYYDGKHRLAFATAKFKEAFARFFPPMANNWMKIIVDAAVERLEVQGFLFDPDPSTPSWNQTSDDEAWEIWQANNLDAQSVMAHTEAIKCGRAFLLVSPTANGPLITTEHPTQVYVETAPVNRRIRLAAIKRWRDPDGYGYAYIYLPEGVHKFRSAEKVREFYAGNHIQWSRVEGMERNPLRQVPIVPLENNPDMLDGGVSDLDVAIPIQDAVNKLCLDMQVSSEFHAYPQRWATGWDVPKTKDSTGKQVVDLAQALKASQATVWASEGSETKFGQLEPGQVDNYIKPIELYVRHMAALTRTPPHYLLGEMANLAADAIRAAEAGLTYRSKRKQLDFSDGWEDAMRLAFLAKGNQDRAKAVQAQTLWKDPETKSLAQLTDAAVKWRESLDVPAEVVWQLLGFSPQQIKQMLAMNGWTPGGAATRPPSDSNGEGDPAEIVLPTGVT